jgi:hypothetical protein
MTTATPDFVQVQLTAAGVAFAGSGGSVRVANGHFTYLFTATAPVRVLISEWRRTLSTKTFQGAPILAIVPDAEPPAAATPKKAAGAAGRVISPAASHTDAPEQKSTQTIQAAPASAAPNEVK